MKNSSNYENNPAFRMAVDFVLQDHIEGIYSNDSRDKGGETRFGISKRAYPQVNIAELTREEAIDIYWRDYWKRVKCDLLQPKIAIVLFDCAVNQGPIFAVKIMQKSLNILPDGIIGPKTLARIDRSNQNELLVQFLGQRLYQYSQNKQRYIYMRGWSNRILYLYAFIIQNVR